MKKRQTALDIAAKLPVADLLPMLAWPHLAKSGLATDAHTRHSWSDADRAAEPAAGKRSLIELEAENMRLRGAIAQLSGSLLGLNWR